MGAPSVSVQAPWTGPQAVSEWALLLALTAGGGDESVQGGVRSSGAVVAELANAAQREFQRKRWLVRCWTSDRVLCILLVALSGSLTGV